MGLLNLSLPAIGEASATADQKVRDGLNAIQTWGNGQIDATNLSPTMTIPGVWAFSTYRGTNVPLTSGAQVPYDTEEFDPSNGVVGASFNPQLPGYYRLNWSVYAAGAALAADTYWYTMLRKNAVNHHAGSTLFQRGTATNVGSVGTAVVQANGTTDTFDVTINHNAGAAVSIQSGIAWTYFNGELVGRS